MLSRRIVVKLGTQVVTSDGVHLALPRLTGLIEKIAALNAVGHQIVLVSSGAVAVGRRVLGLEDRELPLPLGLRQACAAAGQSELMRAYHHVFEAYELPIAQVLVTHHDLADRERTLCLRTTLTRLLELGAVPILNENDSVSVKELAELVETDYGIAFGDNDELAAKIAVRVSADALVLVTNVDGVYPADPSQHPDAQRIDEIELDNFPDVRTGGVSAGGTGGMMTKLEAARHVAEQGIHCFIGDAAEELLESGIELRGGFGTWIKPRPVDPKKKPRISGAEDPLGWLTLNQGAVDAIMHKKASILPIGVVEVEGAFERGDAVEIRDPQGQSLGIGLANYDAESASAIKGCHSREIRARLGWKTYNALITRDNMVLVGV